VTMGPQAAAMATRCPPQTPAADVGRAEDDG